MRRSGQLERAKGSAIGRVLVREPLVWRHALPLQQLAHELADRLHVVLGLDQHVQDLAFCIHGPPEIYQVAANLDRHLVEVPDVDGPRLAR